MGVSTNPVFEKTYSLYLSEIKALPLAALADRLGGTFEADAAALTIELLGRPYQVSSSAITNAEGRRPGFDVCVVLSKYLLRCPPASPREKSWVSFKDFRDAAPLIHYFAKDVEGGLADHFTGRLTELRRSADALGGFTPQLEVGYDVALQFDALPKIPMVLLFNDADEEFPATCKILFQRRCEVYLDAECIAMLAARLYKELKRARAERPPENHDA